MANRRISLTIAQCILALPLQAQTSISAGDGFTMTLKVVTALGIVIALIFASAWLMKRIQMVNPRFGRQIKVIESVVIGKKEKLILVEINNRSILLGVGGQSINVLHEYGSSEVIDEKASSEKNTSNLSTGESFSDFLKSILIKEHRQ